MSGTDAPARKYFITLEIKDDRVFWKFRIFVFLRKIDEYLKLLIRSIRSRMREYVVFSSKLPLIVEEEDIVLIHTQT